MRKNSGSEIKINYYWVSNIITRVRDNRSNMGEFGTIRAFFHIMKLFKKKSFLLAFEIIIEAVTKKGNLITGFT